MSLCKQAWATELRVDALHVPEPIPDPEDVVLCSVEESPTVYTVSRCCGLAQIRCSSYASAFETANRWARTYHADLWLNDHDSRYVLLSRHRPDGQPTAAPCGPR
jgi:hypothetical protein